MQTIEEEPVQESSASVCEDAKQDKEEVEAKEVRAFRQSLIAWHLRLKKARDFVPRIAQRWNCASAAGPASHPGCGPRVGCHED